MAKTLLARTFGRYQLLEQLGQGGMGTVYKAYDPTLDRTVALKLLSPDLVQDASTRQRFEQEARLLAQIQHPNVVTVFDAGVEADQPFLTMAWIQGEDFHAFINRKIQAGQDVSVKQVQAWGLQLADALAQIHAKGILHRDIKPENILINADGNAILTDFGISIRMSSPSTTQSFLGTPEFASPEQFRGETLTPQSDLFALGGVLYLALMGHLPFAATDFAALKQQVLQENPPAIETLRADAPPLLVLAVNRCLAKLPKDRFKDAIALRETLKAIELQKRPKPLKRWVLAALGTASVAVMVWLFYPTNPVQQPSEAPKISLETGKQALEAGQCQAALRYFNDFPDLAEAQFYLGNTYHKCLKDDNKAVLAWKEAAKRGYVPAMENLGILYATNLEKPLEAKRWLEDAAGRGSVLALRGLGTLAYKGGIGLALDLPAARTYFRHAADKGDVESLCYLGMMQYNGEGGAEDLIQGLAHIREAAEKGEIKCQTILKQLGK